MFVFEIVRVPSRSMENTLLAGELVLVEQLSSGLQLPLVNWRLPGLSAPVLGDVLLVRMADPDGREYVKRCVAGAGESVELRDKAVYVDGGRMADPPLSKYIDAKIQPAWKSGRDNMNPHQVPAGQVFVMGDNRDNSRDSRHWGVVPHERVVGTVLAILWSTEVTGSVRWHRLGSVVR